METMLIINWWGFISKQTSLWLLKKWRHSSTVEKMMPMDRDFTEVVSPPQLKSENEGKIPKSHG
jgi:hypothetical protein